MIRRIAERFYLVIIDMEPISQAALRLESGSASPVDAAVLVHDVRRMTEDQVAASIADLNRCGIEAVGIEENFGEHNPAA